jgi:predicted dehydrogenase
MQRELRFRSLAMSDSLLDLDYKPHLPPKTDYGIGIVGCGGIVNYATLPTYKQHGLHVVGCFDVNRSAAEQTAQQSPSPGYTDLDELCADPAVRLPRSPPPRFQLDIAARRTAAGKHVLCQKPFRIASASSGDSAAGERGGSRLAVNQRCAGARALAARTHPRLIGQVTDA